MQLMFDGATMLQMQRRLFIFEVVRVVQKRGVITLQFDDDSMYPGE